MRSWQAFGAAAVMALTAPGVAAAQTVAPTAVTAQSPETLAAALTAAGYTVATGTDDLGDPVLDLQMEGYKARLLFLDCDPASHDRCGSVQFFAAFDAEGPGLSAADAILFARRYRYASVTVNANGDPVLRWDIETGEGIPAKVFQASAARFLSTVRAMGAMLFPAAPAAPAG